MRGQQHCQKGNFWLVWRAPLLIAAVTTLGLLASLLGTGVWHWISWFALVIPILVTTWFSCRGH